MHRNRTWLVDSTETVLRTQRNRILPIEGGDGSTLSLDFTTGVLDPRLTFTRSTSGTYIGADGLVKTMAAAPTNDPTKARFDYDPTTRAPRGLLIEAGATNELQRSNAFNTSPWYTSNFNTPSIASPSVTDPGGGTDTWYCIPSGAGNVIHGFRYNTTFTAVAYTFSIWAKAAQHDKFVISDASGGQGACRFDLTAKTANVIANTVTPTNPQIIEYPNGWFRCSFTMVMPAALRGMTYSSYPTGATVNAFGATFTATGTDGMYFYGAQTEIGSGASSYIPTEASPGIRAADSCVMTGTNFSSWYASATAGTFYSEFDNPRATIGAAHTPASIGLGDYSAGNLISAYFGGYTVGQSLVAAIWGSGGTGFQTATVPTSVSVATGNKAAFAFSGQSVMGGFRGNASASATTTGTVNAKTVLYIGGNGTSGTVNRDFLNSCIQRIKFFPTQFTNAQLQSLTT